MLIYIVCVFLVFFVCVQHERIQTLLLLPKTHIKTFHLAGIHNLPIEHECVIFNVFLGLACDHRDLDSNEFGYSNPSLSRSFQSVQLQVEVCTQNSPDNGTFFFPPFRVSD